MIDSDTCCLVGVDCGPARSSILNSETTRLTIRDNFIVECLHNHPFAWKQLQRETLSVNSLTIPYKYRPSNGIRWRNCNLKIMVLQMGSFANLFDNLTALATVVCRRDDKGGNERGQKGNYKYTDGLGIHT